MDNGIVDFTIHTEIIGDENKLLGHRDVLFKAGYPKK